MKSAKKFQIMRDTSKVDNSLVGKVDGYKGLGYKV